MSCVALTSPLMRRRTAAALLNVSPTTVDRLVKVGQLPVIKVGGAVRFALPDLEAFIARQKGQVSE
jgi:excisionase family DNA binding protein